MGPPFRAQIQLVHTSLDVNVGVQPGTECREHHPRLVHRVIVRVTWVRSCESWRTVPSGRKCSVTVVICCCISQTDPRLSPSFRGGGNPREEEAVSLVESVHRISQGTSSSCPSGEAIPVAGDRIRSHAHPFDGTVPWGRPLFREKGAPRQKEGHGKRRWAGPMHAGAHGRPPHQGRDRGCE